MVCVTAGSNPIIYTLFLSVREPFCQITEDFPVPGPLAEPRRGPVRGTIRCKSSRTPFSIFAKRDKGVVLNLDRDDCFRFGNGFVVA